MSPIKVGICGYGGSAKIFHLPMVLSVPALEVYAFLQRAEAPTDPASAKPGSHCTIDFPKAKHYRSADEFFADPNIELVIVCTREDTHALFAEKALKAGKHVVVEKAFTRTSQEADHILAISKESGKILTCYQNRRFDSDFLTLQDVLKKDILGDLKEAEIHYDFDQAPWVHRWSETEYSPGKGMIFGLGSHSLDQALLLFGRPKSITAFLKSTRGVDSEIDDSFTVVLQYDGKQKDLLVTVKTTINAPDSKQLKCWFRGEKGAFTAYGTCIQEQQAISGMRASDPKFGVVDPSLYGLLTTRYEYDSKLQEKDATQDKWTAKAYPIMRGNWKGYYENVAGAIKGEAELYVKPEQSRDGIRLIELARESHNKGATVPWS